MLSVSEALRLIEAHARPLAARRVPIEAACGLVLAEDMASDIDLPPHDKALMDGFAVRSSDHETLRRVVEEVPAGAVPSRPVTAGTATRIMTGAPVPDGADAIVPIEQTESADAETVRLTAAESIAAGQHIMRRGESVRQGQTVLRSGATLRPSEIGILAETGHAEALAVPRPSVAVLATGNELVPVGNKLAAGQIRNSNGPMLSAAVAEAGGVPRDLGIADDDRGRLREMIQQGLTADVLLLSGGVSAGDYDFVPQVLTEAGVKQVFHKVAIKPGKPLWFGTLSRGGANTLVFGLPGNPVSSFVCFQVFVRPALAALAGKAFGGLLQVRAKLTAACYGGGNRTTYLPARVELRDQANQAHAGSGVPLVTPIPWKGSADLAVLASADALAIVPDHSPPLAAGDAVDVLLLGSA